MITFLFLLVLFSAIEIVDVWLRHLSIEKNRYLYIRLFPEPSRLSKEQLPPPFARFMLRVTTTGTNRRPYISPGKLYFHVLFFFFSYSVIDCMFRLSIWNSLSISTLLDRVRSVYTTIPRPHCLGLYRVCYCLGAQCAPIRVYLPIAICRGRFTYQYILDLFC